jgi:GTP-binding protein EngB required for normal cell division
LRWAQSHNLGINHGLQLQQQALIPRFGDRLTMASRFCKFGGVEYFHFLITDGTWSMEFGVGNFASATVIVHSNPQSDYEVEKTFNNTPEVQARMLKVCGATNYSLCLRNCEHVARYIYCGQWICMQMAGGSSIAINFVKDMSGHTQKLINTLPDDLKPITVFVPLWPGVQPFINGHQNAQGLSAADQEAYNVVVIGPTGSGKSAIINRWFNLKVCESRSSAMSVTKEMHIHSGRAIIAGKSRKINVMDSIGFCDSTLSAAEVLQLVKDSVKLNMLQVDSVVVVVSGRIEGAHADAIKTVLEWLKYNSGDNYMNFSFIYNKADTADDDGELEMAIFQMASMLGVGGKSAGGTLYPSRLLPSTRSRGLQEDKKGNVLVQKLLSCGIPPRATYEEAEAEHLKVLDSTMLRSEGRLDVRQTSCLIL